MTKIIDTRGMQCPQPLITTRKAFKASVGSEHFEILIDSETVLNNVSAYLKELKQTFTVEKLEDIFHVKLQYQAGAQTEDVPAEQFCSSGVRNAYVVAIRSEKMGEEETLGKMLLYKYLTTIAEGSHLPSAIVLYNSGVKIATEHTDTAQALTELEEKGVPVFLCGLCTQYFEMNEQIGVGTISNMMKISELLAQADHIIYP